MAAPLSGPDHYGTADLTERIDRALEQARLDEGSLTWPDLAPLDQFHVRGLAATKELAEGLRLEAGTTVIDVGCGLGGPARYLAATHGCRVTGIDLSRRFIDVAQTPSERARALCERNVQAGGRARSAVRGSRLRPCLDAACRDEHHRQGPVLRKHSPRAEARGRLAIYDVVAGDGGPLIFPVPWARQPEISFVVTIDAMWNFLTKAGFEEISWADKTDAAVSWLAEQKTAQRSPPVASPLGLHVVLGSGFPEMAANFSRNLRENRARLIQAIVQRV